MIRTTQHTIDRWTAQGRRFIPATPRNATHRTRTSYFQEVTRTNPRAGLTHAVRPWMRNAIPATPVEQTEDQLAQVARVART